MNFRSRETCIHNYPISPQFDTQVPRQHCCRRACQILKRCDYLNYLSRGFETSRDLMRRHLIGYWNGAQVSMTGTRNYIPQILWNVITYPGLDACFRHTSHSRLPLFLLLFSCFHRPRNIPVFIEGKGWGRWEHENDNKNSGKPLWHKSSYMYLYIFSGSCVGGYASEHSVGSIENQILFTSLRPGLFWGNNCTYCILYHFATLRGGDN